MKNIKNLFITFFAFCICMPAVASAQLKNEIYSTNGSVISSTPGASGEYVNSTVAPNGFLLSGVSHDYRMETGFFSLFMNTNSKIEIVNLTPSSSTVTNVTLSAKITTLAGNVDQVGFKIDNPFSNYVYLVNGDTGEASVTVSTEVVLQPGTHNIYWFARNSVDSDGNANMYTITVKDTDNSITIAQPVTMSGPKPLIQATIVSRSGISAASDLSIRIFRGNSTSGVLVSSRTADSSIFNITTGELNYKYDRTPLEDGKQYTLQIAFDDGDNIFDALSVFKVSNEAISYLLPYPSPYNPKKGDMTIKFIIADQASVSINIYDRAGKLVSKVLDSENRSSGENKVTWNAKSYAGDKLANGVYICEIITKSGGKESRSYKSFAILRK